MSSMAVEFDKGIRKSSCGKGIKSIVNNMNRKVYFHYNDKKVVIITEQMCNDSVTVFIDV